MSSRVKSLHDAFVLLGLDTVRMMALSVVTSEYAKATRQAPELHRCWRHTIATALIAGDLARASSVRPDQAYTAGLLHDLGRLGLLAAFPREYTAMLQEADAGGQKEDSTYLLDCERQHFGIDHCEAGLWLSNEWNLPEELGVIASRHHDRSYGKSAKMLTIAAISCRLADALGFDVVRTTQPFTLEMALDSLPAETRKRFPVDEETLKGQIEKKISEFESPGGPDGSEPGRTGGESDPAEHQAHDLGAKEQLFAENPAAQQTPQPSSSDSILLPLLAGAIFVAAVLVFLQLVSR